MRSPYMTEGFSATATELAVSCRNLTTRVMGRECKPGDPDRTAEFVGKAGTLVSSVL